MFRKIISSLSFSPALVGQLGFYAKRLRKEEVSRRLGLVFVVLALLVQGLVIFDPPQSANAANSSDFVYGGLGLGANKSLNNFLNPYDSNSTNLRDIMNSVGITRAEIAAAQFGSWRTPGKISWGREPRPGEVGSVIVKNDSGATVGAIHGRPMTVANGDTTIYGWIGHSAHVGWFAVMQYCGNLVTDIVPPPVTPPPTPEPPKPAEVVLSKQAVNVSQGLVDASTLIAKESDQIRYTLTVENKGGTAAVTKLEDNLGDVLEYATILDYGGGVYNKEKRVLSWPDINLKPDEKQTRTFTVRLLDTIPATPKGQSDPSSYNCKMENVFGNSITVTVDCAPPKVIEEVVPELPHTGPTENLIFASVLLAVVTYFYARTRQLGKEVRLVRKDLNTGAL